MKLVSITLLDVRRFSQPVRVEGIDAGLNVLSAPNESGKSSLFDALQALFFVRHGSTSKEIKALRPISGGSPEVSAEIDTAEGRFRIVKRWLSRAMAEVWKGEHLVARGEKAEEWIARVMQGGGEVGPAGLLWVRQGLTALDQGSARDIEAAQAVRRDLMSSVTGELELVTGGRRMDKALARAQADLALYVTGRGAKKGGPLHDAETAVTGLRAERDRLADIARCLRDAIERRQRALRALAELRDPQAVAARELRLAEATAARETAARHAEAVERARAAVTTARLQRDAAVSDLSHLRQLRERQVRALQLQAETAAQARMMTQALAGVEARLVIARATFDAARTTQAEAEAVHLSVLKAEAQRAATQRRKGLAERIAAAEGLAQELSVTRIAAKTGPDAREMTAIEMLAQEVAVQRHLRERSATQVTLRYLGADSPRVVLSGTVVAEGEAVAVLADAAFDLPGIGRLELHPGRSGDEDGLAKAEAGVAQALARLGLDSIDGARAAAQARATAEAKARDLQARLKTLAGDGIDALRTELLALPETAMAETALPDHAAAQAAAAEAALRRAAAEKALEAARLSFDGDRDAEARATVTAEAATAALRLAEADLAAVGDIPARETRLRGDLESAEAAIARSETTMADLLDKAPDLDACDVALGRARSVCDQVDAEIRDLTEADARLGTEIELRSGSGVDEDLEDVTLRLAEAERRLEAIALEVDVLKKLIGALETARETAREQYFEPVMVELKPLLRLLWPDADLTFDGDSLLPTTLSRHGRTEDIGTLSGGTQEQIALLVRLAFARLLAKGGRHAPVILDDALVYSDDDRIERMFDALHRQAQDLQIIVLSCRQRAFRELGGRKLTLEPLREAATAR